MYFKAFVIGIWLLASGDSYGENKVPMPEVTHPEWYRCSAHGDCQVGIGMCDGVEAVNTQARVEHDKWWRERNRFIKCQLGAHEEFSALCIEGRCRLKGKVPVVGG